jgi:uncharacterized membrane protein YbhN (UPF0104 family)
MGERLRRWWPVLKALLGVALLLAIGRQFWRDLRDHPEVLQRPMHLGWLVFSGGLYLLGLGFSAWYWRRLLVHLGRQPTAGAVARAYYVSQLGKYLPGKAMTLVMRAGLIRGAGVGPALATVTAFYEVLTMMTAGALLATVLFALLAPDTGTRLSWDDVLDLVRLQTPPGGLVDCKISVLFSLGLLSVCLIPVLPPVFNQLVYRLTRPFRAKDASVPVIRFRYLGEGLLLMMCGWLLLGASMAATMEGTLGPGLPWTVPLLGRVIALAGMSYIAGFVILVAPGGLGVREYLLSLFLTAEVAALRPMDAAETTAATVLVVVVLRLVWTLAEVVIAGLLYWMPLLHWREELKNEN